MKLQAFAPSSCKSLQSQTRLRPKNRLPLNGFGDFHGRRDRSSMQTCPLGGINRKFNRCVDNIDMRVAGSTIVALLALHFVDEQYNDGRYSRAATMMLSHITKSFS